MISSQQYLELENVSSMYNDIVAFKGDLTMGKDYLIGTGYFRLGKGKFNLANIHFKARLFFTKKGDLKSESRMMVMFVFATKKCKCKCNF